MMSHKIRLLKALVVCLCMFNVLSCIRCNNILKMQLIEYGSITSAMLHYVCPSADLLKLHSSTNLVGCSILCQQESSCLGFFFARDSQSCALCSGQYSDTSSLEPHHGTEYYSLVFPVWNPWSSWSVCSKTCSGGTKTRTRTCQPNNRAPWSNDVETVNCNIYSCTPSEMTCAGWATKGLDGSANVQIDPLGTGPVEVVCDMNTEPGKAWTLLGHNYEQRTYVNGYEASFSYDISIVYNISLEAAIKLADLSTECKQYVKWECRHQYIRGTSSWENRHGNISSYLTGSPPPGKFCACGETGTCSDTSKECECDINDYVWRVDEGYVTTKGDLPITGIRAGDTGSVGEMAYHTLGPLMCA